MLIRQIKKKLVFGIDEVGRGPLAGPVIACAITVRQFSIFTVLSQQNSPKGHFQFSKKIKNLKDSKKMSPKKRKEVFDFLKKLPQVRWGIGRVSEKMIDKINIFEATKLAMIRAVKNLEKKVGKKSGFLLIDGNFGLNLKVPQKSIIKGDEKVFLIKLASIVAKVTRDDLMLRHHRKYPLYKFDRHKGYGTKLHLEMLKKHGPCQIHRKTFRPVANLVSVAKK